MRPLRLSHQQVQAIVEQAKAAAPLEDCGLIAGSTDGIAQQIYPIPNRSDKPTQHFDMEPVALLRAYKQIEAAGQTLLAVYHSHPTSDPIPSPADIRDAMLNMPNVAHLIVSLKSHAPRLQVWHIHAGQVERVELLVGSQQSHNMDALTRAQILAIVLATLLAVALLLTLSFALLPPAPPIPTPT